MMGDLMLKKILIGVVVLVVGLLLFINSKPDDFKVSRSTLIKASPEAVFEQVNDFHAWERWSPWVKVDPKAKTVYQGPAQGVGAVFNWDGNNDVGKGSMTIIESKPSDYIKLLLNFEKPFEGKNNVEFTFKKQGDQTYVTWSMFGKSNFFGKALSLVFNCDQMIGGQYEKGLAQLKAVVEQAGAVK